MLYQVLTVLAIVLIFVGINYLYMASNRGLFIQTDNGRAVLLKHKQAYGFHTRRYVKDSDLYAYKRKGVRYSVDFWTLNRMDATKVYDKLNILEYMFMVMKYKQFKRHYDEIEDYLLSSKKEYLMNGYYYSYNYKKYNETQIQARIEKDLDKIIDSYIDYFPDYKKEISGIKKNYTKKNYKYMLEMIPLIDTLGRKMFDTQVLSNNKKKNMYQVIDQYGGIDFYSFIIANPLISSAKSKMTNDIIVNRHKMVHEVSKNYYTNENYLRLINIMKAMQVVKESEF